MKLILDYKVYCVFNFKSNTFMSLMQSSIAFVGSILGILAKHETIDGLVRIASSQEVLAVPSVQVPLQLGSYSKTNYI